MSKVMGIVISAVITVGAVIGIIFFSVTKRRGRI